MLEDVPGLVNPIVQAMIAHANQLQQGKRLELDTQKAKEEANARKEQLKQSQQILENLHEHQQATAQVEQTRAEAEALQNKANTLLHLNTVNATGGGGQAMLDALMPTIAQTIKSTGQPLFATPQTEAAATRQKAFAQSQGTAEGALPSEQALANSNFQNQNILQNARLQSSADIAKANRESIEQVSAADRASKELMERLSEGSRQSIANNENATRLRIAGMGMDQDSANAVNAIKNGMMTGEVKLNPTNPIHRLAYTELQNEGSQVVDKKQIDTAKEAQKMLPFLDQLEGVAKKLPENGLSAWATGKLTEAQKSVGWTSDLQNDINMANNGAMNVARTMDGLSGRPLSTQLNQELGSLAAPGIKQSQMIDRINAIRNKYINNENNVIFSGMPSAQREMIDTKYGLKPIAQQSPQTQVSPDFLKVAPKTNKNGKPLDIPTSIQEGAPRYQR
jgi:hypothetical protein